MPAISNDIVKTSCCIDCAMFIANHDDSGASEDWNKDIVVRTLNDYRAVIVGDDKFFSHSYCAICCDDYAGDRMDVDLIPLF